MQKGQLVYYHRVSNLFPSGKERLHAAGASGAKRSRGGLPLEGTHVVEKGTSKGDFGVMEEGIL